MTEPFEVPRQEDIYKNLIGTYVIIYPGSQHRNFSGKLVRIVGSFAILNPFQGGECDSETGIKHAMIYEDSPVHLSYGTAIEPTTQEHLEKYCEYINKQSPNLKNQETKNHP